MGNKLFITKVEEYCKFFDVCDSVEFWRKKLDLDFPDRPKESLLEEFDNANSRQLKDMGLYDTILKRRKDEYKYLEIQQSGKEARGQILYSAYGQAFFVTDVVEPGIIHVVPSLPTYNLDMGRHRGLRITDDSIKKNNDFHHHVPYILKRSGDCYRPTILNEKGKYIFAKPNKSYTLCY